jgi:type VI secretion system protein ImpC
VPKPYDFGRVELDVEPKAEKPSLSPDSETPFRILVTGDFTGRASRGIPAHRPKPVLVDRDNFDYVMARLAPSLRLESAEGREISLSFRDLDDFHPDRLFEQLDLFSSLRQLRDQLQDPELFRETAEQLQAPPARAAKAPQAASLAAGSLLDDMIEATETRSPKARRSDPVQDFVRQIVAPHIVPKANPKQAEMIAQVDAATSAEMRALLHHPRFQALESLWRSLFQFVRNVETGPQLKIFILDLTKPEMASGVIDQLIDMAGDEPWSLLVADETFGQPADLRLLSYMGKVARKAGAAFLAAADLSALGSDEWEALRSTSQASYIGLAMPRVLLRLPYDKQNIGIEQFDFEEIPEPKHEGYLWGNPAFACATLIAETFSADGWEMRLGQFQELSGFPIHTYVQDGETKMKPCAEVWLTQREVELLLEQGIMPLISMKNSDRVRVGRIQSIRTGAVPLAGRWS